MKNILQTSENIFFAPERTGGFGDWESRMERMERLLAEKESREQRSAPQSAANTILKGAVDVASKSKSKPNSKPKTKTENLSKNTANEALRVQEERKKAEDQRRPYKEKELHFAIDAITNLKPGWQTVGGMKKKFEKYGVNLARVLDIAVREDRKVAEVLWVEIQNNPELLAYLKISDENALMKETAKIESSTIKNALFNAANPNVAKEIKNNEKLLNEEQREGGESESADEADVDKKEIEDQKKDGGYGDVQELFLSKGIDIKFIQTEFGSNKDLGWGHEEDVIEFKTAFGRLVDGKDITKGELAIIRQGLHRKIQKDIAYNLANSKLTKNQWQIIAFNYFNFINQIEGGEIIKKTPESISSITDVQIKEVRDRMLDAPEEIWTYVDFKEIGLSERQFDGELGKKLYSNGAGEDFVKFDNYASQKTSDVFSDKKAFNESFNIRDEYKVYAMTGLRPGSKEFDKAVQESKARDNFLATAREMAGRNLDRLTSSNKTFQVERTTSRTSVMQALFSGEILEFPLRSNFSGGRSVRVAFKEGQPVVRFAGNEFDISGVRETEKFLRLFQGMADDPILMLTLESGDAKGLEPLLKNFHTQYPTEAIGDNPEKFYRTTFKLFAESTQLNWLNFSTDTEVRRFMEKMQDPRMVQRMRLELREKGLITQEGVINNASIQKAKLQNTEKKQKEKDQHDAEFALQELQQIAI